MGGSEASGPGEAKMLSFIIIVVVPIKGFKDSHSAFLKYLIQNGNWMSAEASKWANAGDKVGNACCLEEGSSRERVNPEMSDCKERQWTKYET